MVRRLSIGDYRISEVSLSPSKDFGFVSCQNLILEKVIRTSFMSVQHCYIKSASYLQEYFVGKSRTIKFV
jgi:hypothetical protein